MYVADQVADYIINWCLDNKIQITNLKLQKLLYFVQGENYRYRRQRLFKDDFYAWKLGPVIPSIYNGYAIYSSAPLPRQASENTIDPETRSFIDKILQKYAIISTWDLVDLSHSQDPWKDNYNMFGEKSIIPFESIAQFYGED